MADWTIETLRQHFLALRESDSKAIAAALAAAEKAVAAALAASEKAVTKAETNAEKWRDSANEWRGAMNDRERVLMPRQEAEVRLAMLEKSINTSAGKGAGLNAAWGYLIGAIGLATGIVSLILRTR